MAGLCEGRVVIVTGAGRGIGRAHALEFAREGAKVVVNDLGAEVDGSGSSSGPAGEVVDEIRKAGGEAVANGDDVSDWQGAQNVVKSAIEAFGGLNVLVNNAGILRDRMLVNMEEAEWDAVMRVHLKGTFCMTRHAATHWREKSKAGGSVDASVINTSSAAGLFGNAGQTNYGAAKAGIAAFTIIAAQELGRYGVRCNAIAPGARTRMTEQLFSDMMKAPEGGGFDPMAPENISPLVVWLASSEAKEVTGRVFEIFGSLLCVLDGWRRGPSLQREAQWTPSEIGPALRDLLAKAPAQQTMMG